MLLHYYSLTSSNTTFDVTIMPPKPSAAATSKATYANFAFVLGALRHAGDQDELGRGCRGQWHRIWQYAFVLSYYPLSDQDTKDLNPKLSQFNAIVKKQGFKFEGNIAAVGTDDDNNDEGEPKTPAKRKKPAPKSAFHVNLE
ncbi:hypothetical protein LTS07_002392 [Exophiala sideris]|uniref:Uncharacterized protein n=1 Tax=Exophiala sideris TaxID=1016849 RepID=A0ABR0JM73_9EURO|nr:hypothetical protein LTS07_002392 [Exophiala sideris]KAK5067048.1 hypothetical protein LTR69_002397 [Exophiala sideris]